MANQISVSSTPAALDKILKLPGVKLVTKGRIKAFDEARKKEHDLQRRITPLDQPNVTKRRKEILHEISENPDGEAKARKELHELDRAPEIRAALKENGRKTDLEICLPLAVEIFEDALSHVRPAADLFIADERDRYAAFGLDHVDSPLALGIEESVRRLEGHLDSFRRRLAERRGIRGTTLAMVAGLVDSAR